MDIKLPHPHSHIYAYTAAELPKPMTVEIFPHTQHTNTVVTYDLIR